MLDRGLFEDHTESLSMFMVVVDESCFTGVRDEARKTLKDFCASEGLLLSLKGASTEASDHRFDIVGLTGLGVAVVALAISYLQLRRTPKLELTRAKLIEEIDSYLRLRGVTQYHFTFEEGFENLLAKNGRTCVVGVQIEAPQIVQLYFAVTPEKIYVSSHEIPWRSIT
jgi:hypothetical protein